MIYAQISRVVCSFAAIVLILAFFLNVPLLHQWQGVLTNWGIIVSAFALGLGAINLFKRHGERIVKRSSGWIYSVVCLTFLLASSIGGILKTTGHPTYQFWFSVVIEACQASVSSLVVCYIATSAFRAFRLRNMDAGLMLVTSVIAMLGQAPIGTVIHRSLPDASGWLMSVINTAGQRGIMMAAALGAMAAALRIIFGVERGPFAKGEV